MKSAGKGILTMAYGEPRYLRQAINFAKSLIVTNPNTARAIITDSPENPKLKKYFHHLIPIRKEFGRGMVQKVFVYEYSPFEETLCIDADCFALRPFDDLWKAMSAKPYALFGQMLTHNNEWFNYIETYRKLLNKPAIPGVSGGVHYFNRSPQAQAIADRAMALAMDFRSIATQADVPIPPNDETCLSFAFAEAGIEPVDDSKLRRQIGPMQMMNAKVICDVPRHRFRCITSDAAYDSFIMHFYWDWDKGFHYDRETLKLNLAVDFGISPSVASTMVNTLLNPGYYLFTETYRRIKRIKSPSENIPRMTCWPYSHFGGGLRSRIKL